MRWLVLIHQIPPSPAYLRVKIGRKLARLGAIALKSTVYVLPRSDATLEDLQWVRREIVAGGGDATVVSGELAVGVSDLEVEEQFRKARDSDYEALALDARAVAKKSPKRLVDATKDRAFVSDLARLARRLDEIKAIDFFAARGRSKAIDAIDALRARLAPPPSSAPERLDLSSLRGKTWVTRKGVHVDRIASAWLVRRFIDEKARFRFVVPRGHQHRKNEIRFDMFDAEFSHEGDSCTFEVLSARLDQRPPGLVEIGEIIHDIDLKDHRYGRPETAGVAALIAGIALRHRDDDERLEQGFELFDSLLAFYARTRN